MLDIARAVLASRGFITLALCTGFFLSTNQFANSQSVHSDRKSVDITIDPPPPIFRFPPTNDNFANSILLSNFTAIGSGFTSGATAESGEPAHDGHSATKSVWWRWIAPDNGLAKLNTQKVYGYPTWDPYHQSAGIPCYVGIYTGSTLTNLSQVPLLPGTSPNVGTDSGEPRTYIFQANSAETYHFAADTLYGCTFYLSLANILLTQPTVLTNLPGDQPVALEYSPFDTNTPIVWLEAFAGTNSLGAVTNPPFQFDYVPSGPGSVAIWAVGTNSLGNTLVSFTNAVTFSPLNDNFAHATVVTNTGESGFYDADTQFATAEPGEPDIIPGSNSTHSVWWKWNPVYDVITRVTLSSAASRLAIFKGTELASLEFIGTLQNPEFPVIGPIFHHYATFAFTPEPGATYFVLGEGSTLVSWSFFQQTFEFIPAGIVQGFDGDTFDLQAIWHEPIGPPGPVDIVIGYENYPIIGIPPPVIGRLGPYSAPPYSAAWTPTNCGTYFLWASFTNGFFTTNYYDVGGVTNLVPATRDTDKTVFRILPRNDFFTNATVIAPDTRTTNFSFNMTGASVESPEPRHRDGPAVGTRWWRWTPSYSATVEIKAIRQSAAAPLDVYTGDSIATLRRVADNSSKVYRGGVSGSLRVPVKSGKTYFIRVDDYVPAFCPPYGPDFITLTLQPAAIKPRGELSLDLIGNTHRQESGIAVPVARVFMPDGQSPVAGSNFRAQLYTGPTPTNLALVGPAMPFYDSRCIFPASIVGVPWPIAVILPDTKPFTRVFAQVRVWDFNLGNSYEAAQAAGGLIGESKVLRVITGSEDSGPAPLTGIRSFSLHGPN